MSQRTVRQWALGALVVFACSVGCDASGCEILEPLPEGNEVPKNQTIEGGLQTRITPGGFEKISAVIPGMVEELLGNGITVIDESHNSWGGTAASLDFWMCPGGCDVFVAIPPGGISVGSNGQMLIIDITLQLQFTLDFRVKVEIFGFDIADITCGVQISTWQEPLQVTLGIEPYIRDTDGELRLALREISGLSLSGIEFSIVNCGLVGDFLDTFMDYINDIFDWLDMILGNAITEFIVNQWILPLMQDFVDGLLPDPLGLEGQFDVGSLLAGFSPGAEGIVELRMTPGGYVNLLGNGMSLGVITGVNSDYDPTTRLSTMDSHGVRQHSEGHPKMPPMPTADLSMPNGINGGLPGHPRGTFTMAAANELNGVHDAGNLIYKNPASPLFGLTADLGLGVSETFMDLLGFHLLNSGALCLEVGTSEVSMLTVGLFSIMVNSLGDLVDPEVGDAPMRLVIRPQTPMEFTIGNPYNEDNPTPLIDLYLRDFQIDVYAFAEGRYVRAFTMALDMNVGVNLYSEVIDETVYIKPAIQSIAKEDVTVRIHNSELIGDKPADLEVLFPSVLSMLMPMLTGALPDIPLPELMGIKMADIEFRPNDSQRILLILASLAMPSPVPPHPAPPLPLGTRATLQEVYVPSPEALRASLLDPAVPAGEKNVPFVKIALEANGVPPGRVPEWQYRLNGGTWRWFQRGSELVIKDETFYFQGWHRVEVRGRVAGSSSTLERTPQVFNVLIDSVSPMQKARVQEGLLHFGGFDLVTPRSELEYSYALEPGRFSEWSKRSTLPLHYAHALAEAHGGVLRVRARDEAGNVSEAEIPALLMAASPVVLPSAGCGCATEGLGGGGLGLFLALLGLVGLWRRRRRPFDRSARSLGRSGALVVLAAVVALGACAKKSPGGEMDAGPPPCSDDDDCSALQCEPGQIPLCILGRCMCMDDLVVGKVGPHSSHAESTDQIFVAAYNERYGDLMFASIRKGDIGSNPVIKDTDFEFVDGVPWDQPPDVPTSEIRNGIRSKGDNVGRYTSMGVDDGGNPVIAYYDLSHGALKLARKEGPDWRTLVVDNGGSSEGPHGGDAGRYTSMSMRPADRAPGIAYFVQYLPGSDAHHMVTELRFAQADTASPVGPGSWMIYTVDSVEIEVPTDDEGSPLPPEDWPLGDWPMGVGVTSAVTRTSDGRPVVVYYDSVNGNLKASEFDGTAFTTPVILDGEEAGVDTGNVGLFPSVRVTPGDDTQWHVSYVDVGLRQLLYLCTGTDPAFEVVDHGLRQEVNDITGLPMPVSHMVGFDSKIVLAGSRVFVAYQDATDHELLWAERNPTATGNPWHTVPIAGHNTPTLTPGGEYEYEGAFGFYIGLTNEGSNVAYLSSYAINEWARSNLAGDPPVNYWVQIFAVQLGEG